MLKKIYIFTLIIILILSPIMLTGCVPGGTSGGGTGDIYVPVDPVDPDDPDDPVDPDDPFDPYNPGETESYAYSDYFDGVKITYNPDLSGDLSGSPEKIGYINDVKSQINTMSKEVIIRLMSEYGNGIGLGGYRLYYYVNGIQQFEDIYADGFEPFDSVPASYGVDYKYAHKDAVRKDYYNTGVDQYYTWNWTLVQNYNPADYIDAFLTAHSDNLQIAIYMLKLNKNIYQIGTSDYNEYISYTQLSLGEKETLKENFAKEITYIGMLEEEMYKLGQFILNVVIGNTLVEFDVERFIDVNNNGLFDAEEFIDSIPNGQFDAGEKYNDLNNNDEWDSGVPLGGAYDFIDEYFKNYRNTVNAIITTISENTVRYPQIAGIQYQDFIFADVESNLDEIFTIPTGMQCYKSLIFMNSQAVSLDSVWLAFESTRSFNLEITARYHKVSEGIIFDDVLTTLLINGGAYDISDNDNDFEIDIQDILNTYGLSNSNLQSFTNNTESFDEPVVLNTTTPAADYFIVEKAEDGVSSLAKYNDNSTDFFEIVFSATSLSGDINTNPILFRFGFIDISFTPQVE